MVQALVTGELGQQIEVAVEPTDTLAHKLREVQVVLAS
jgi:hypothetical protein